MRSQGANVDDGQKPGCKHGMRSGGTARRKERYERAIRKAHARVFTLRAKRRQRLTTGHFDAARKAFRELHSLKVPMHQKAWGANEIARMVLGGESP